MNVVSYFDGMSCGQLALKRAGVKIQNYFACEIDKYSSQVAINNFPNMQILGDVTKVNLRKLPKIDLFIGGSPCQGFSFAGKQLNFEDPRSKLFFEFAADLRFIQETINPDVKFLLENVKMKKEYQDIISVFLGVQPVEVNSALVSAQNRKRLYWTNICEITQPEDKGILLKDIVHEHADFLNVLQDNFNINPSGKGMNGIVRSVNNPKSNCLTTNKGEGQKISIPIREYAIKDKQTDYLFKDSALRLKKKYAAIDPEKAICLMAKQFQNWSGNFVSYQISEFIVPFEKTLQILDKEVARGKVGYFRKDSQANRVYYIHDKAVTLCGDAGGGAAKMGQYLFGCITPDRIEKRQNGQRFNEGTKFYTLTAQDKHGILIEGYIRKLTPIECERLQTVPDNYTAGVSNSQRYKMLGNGWTVDVIAHIFKNLIKDDFNENLDF